MLSGFQAVGYTLTDEWGIREALKETNSGLRYNLGIYIVKLRETMAICDSVGIRSWMLQNKSVNCYHYSTLQRKRWVTMNLFYSHSIDRLYILRN